MKFNRIVHAVSCLFGVAVTTSTNLQGKRLRHHRYLRMTQHTFITTATGGSGEVIWD